jgi:hypothetical protein
MNETHGPASPLPEGRADGRAIEAALRELVRLKDLKDRMEALGGLSQEFVAARADYGMNQPRAWAAARAALAAPVVAVPEAGERPASMLGETRIADEDPDPQMPTVAMRPMDEADDDWNAPLAVPRRNVTHWKMTRVSAPAVPVGVQPEPAEERRTCEQCGGHGGPGGLAPCRKCGGAGYYLAPAVPVVHPEPGDRDRLLRYVRAILWTDQAGNWDAEMSAQAVLSHVDAEVAAAVAAVRADTADELAKIASSWRMDARPDFTRFDYARALDVLALDLRKDPS